MLERRGTEPFVETSVEIVGAGSIVGEDLGPGAGREAVLKIGARHRERAPLELLAREIAPAACAMAQGLTGLIGGRPAPSPVVRLFSFLIDREHVDVRVDLDGVPVRFSGPAVPATFESAEPAVLADASGNGAGGGPPGDRRSVPLRALAWGRSGDKGDCCNIGVIARHASFAGAIAEQLTAERVAQRFAYVARGPVRRYDLPGFAAFNFVLENALGGGGVASLRYDPLGKSYAQILLDEPILVPAAWIGADGRIAPLRASVS
jgi:hypothetical protein